MLNENIKALRKSKGLSQQELAIKLNVVRQTISKWEQGLSVPDSDLLIALSEALETPVSTLLGEPVIESEADAVKALSEKLEIINLQFARRKATRKAILHWLLIALCAGVVIISAVLVTVNSPYLGWDYSCLLYTSRYSDETNFPLTFDFFTSAHRMRRKRLPIGRASCRERV